MRFKNASEYAYTVLGTVFRNITLLYFLDFFPPVVGLVSHLPPAQTSWQFLACCQRYSFEYVCAHLGASEGGVQKADS